MRKSEGKLERTSQNTKTKGSDFFFQKKKIVVMSSTLRLRLQNRYEIL